MLAFIIKTSIKNRLLILFCIALICLLGAWNFTKLPIDAVPDITNTQVVINTEAQGYTPLEVEQRVSYPIEMAMAGLPNLEHTRSLSRYGLSQVTVIFKDGTDIYFARQLVNEKLNNVQRILPQSLEPTLGPIATGLGEIFMFTVDAKPNAKNQDGTPVSPIDLRTIHDWIIRPQLLRVPGVVEVNPIGGFKKEILVTLEPEKLLAYNITQQDIINSIKSNNANRGVGFIEHNGAQWLLRVPGQADDLQHIENALIKTVDGTPIKIKNIADVRVGKQLRNGAAMQNGKEVVMSTVFMLIGENSRTVAEAVGKKLEEIKSSLPPGVKASPVYDRTKLVNQTLTTVKKNLTEGALLVIVVIFLMLGNLRAALLTASIIPITMLMTISGMVYSKVSANLMSLGALDFGLIVDGAIIIVENCLRRLNENHSEKPLSLQQRLTIVSEATEEVIKPALFGVFIITIVYVPIFALSGVEGKMFHPMAITVIIALLSALLLSITFVPASVAILFTTYLHERESKLMLLAHKLYKPILHLSLSYRWIVIGAACVLLIITGVASTRLGSEFIPNLDEGDIAMHALRIPGTSLTQALNFQKVLEVKIKELPEVERVFSKVGTAEVATDAVPPSVADNFIILKPRDQWPNPKKPKSEIIKELSKLVNQIPGSKYEFLQPIQMRFNELLAGVRSELAIKVYGDDFKTIEKIGKQIESSVANINGLVDVVIEQTTGLPVLNIIPKQEQLSRHGLSIDNIQDQLATALGGSTAGQLYKGDRRIDIVLRLPETLRTDVASLNKLPIQKDNKNYIPLEELANLEVITGFNQIYRENGKRRMVVTANVRGLDLGTAVEQVKTVIKQNVMVPSGYWIEYDGTYKKLQSATQRLKLVIPLTLILIVGLLILALGSLKDATIIFTGIPFALTGGVFSIMMRDIPFSISAAVGFIALSGIAILNGLVMVTFIRQLRKQGLGVHKAVIEGALTRLRPVLTTALVASLGFVPMALNTGIGSEVQRPLATVVIGGIISSTLLTLLVLPALYRIAYSKNSDKN